MEHLIKEHSHFYKIPKDKVIKLEASAVTTNDPT